ncbi:hypothetical protein ACTFIR_012862 [Dictyostelium discoideum]
MSGIIIDPEDFLKSKTPKQLSKKHINIPIPDSLKTNKVPTVSLINITNEEKKLQIVGGVIALGAVGYLIYRYWPSSLKAVEVVRDVVENSVKDSVSSTL